MMPKVVFIFPSYGIGGTTVSTRNLISLLVKEGYDCWVMPMNPQGVLLHLYDDVPRVETPFVIHALAVRGWKKENTWPRQLGAMLIRFFCHHFLRFESWAVGHSLDKIVNKHHFDVIVAGQEGLTTRFVSYARSQKKVAWVRCDYTRLFENNPQEHDSLYDSFKSIVCVSEKTFGNFMVLFPEQASKTICISNPQDGTMMQRRADEVEHEPKFKTDDTTLVSIGRFDPVKRFDQIAPIARQLKGLGLKFYWYLIGDGVERKRIEDSIVEWGMENEVIMLGAKANPYYYIKRADALVCLSQSEACPRVVNEAKILHTPTISTDYPSIYEFIKNEETGIITPLEGMPDAINRLISDGELRERIKANISRFEFDNTELIAAIKSIL